MSCARRVPTVDSVPELSLLVGTRCKGHLALFEGEGEGEGCSMGLMRVKLQHFISRLRTATAWHASSPLAKGRDEEQRPSS
jgi:hypothetical protein